MPVPINIVPLASKKIEVICDGKVVFSLLSIEIVVNDLGVLRLINTKYTHLKPVFGRLIHKILKTPLIDTY